MPDNQTTDGYTSPPFIDPYELVVHKLYRERIVEEDRLINDRMTWMILSQAFLFALWGALYASASLPFFVFFAIEAAGLFGAWGSKRAIHAAERQIDTLREIYLQLYNSDRAHRKNLSWEILERPPLARRPGSRLDVLPGLTGSDNFHKEGHFMPMVFPYLLMFLWISFVTYSAVCAWHLHDDARYSSDNILQSLLHNAKVDLSTAIPAANPPTPPSK